MNRWHSADSVPVLTSFEGDIEKHFPNSRPTLFTAVAHWYLTPGGKDPYPAASLSRRAGHWTEAKGEGGR